MDDAEATLRAERAATGARLDDLARAFDGVVGPASRAAMRHALGL